MRIGIDARPFSVPKTGVGHYMYQVLKAAIALDEENEYFLYSNKPFEVDLTVADRIHIRMDQSKRGTLWVHTRLPFLLKRDGIDLFWGPNFTIPFFPSSIAKVLGIHDMVHHYFPETLPKQIVLHQKYFLPLYSKWADMILADSISTKKDIVEVLNVHENKVRVVHLAANRYEGLRVNKDFLFEKLGIQGSGYILFVGTIEPRKNIERLIKSYAQLRNNLTNPPQLVIAGGWGWKYEPIKELLKELNLKKHIVFTGYIADEELSVLYKNAGVFFFPSRYEGFGLPPLEAMCYGIPVICSNTSSLPEVVGNAAIMVDPDNYEDMCRALLNVFTDKELRRVLSDNSMKQSKMFSWEKTARETLVIFSEAIEKKGK